MSTFEAGVRARTGLMDGPRFRRAVAATLSALGAHIGLPLQRLGGVLPPELFEVLCGAELGPIDLPAAYLHVAISARMQIGVAIQVVRAVLAELAVALGPHGSAALCVSLPHDWAELVIGDGSLDDHAAAPTLDVEDEPSDSDRPAS